MYGHLNTWTCSNVLYFRADVRAFGIKFSTFASLKSKAVNLVYKDHSWDLKIVAVDDRWSLFRGHLCNDSSNVDSKIVVVT
jgi:hypothetical protein